MEVEIMPAVKNDITQMVATLTDEYRIAAIKYIEFLSQTQKMKAKATLSDIQSIFTNDKGWKSEKEMLSDMANFRRERLAKCEY